MGEAVMSKKTKARCKSCGTCCHFEIPMTLLDIERLARYLMVPAKEVFEEYVQKKASARSDLFMVCKDQKNACVFLAEDNSCQVHETRPRACEFFFCAHGSTHEALPWTVRCTDRSMRDLAWEHSVSASVTRKYIRKNGSTWVREDYRRAVESIRINVRTRESQTLKVAMNGQGAVLSLLYDCTMCDERGVHACRTPVTLDDISRIVSYLCTTADNFFRDYLEHDPASDIGTLLLKRDEHCVFFAQGRRCQIEDVRPMHCRFTPCPMRAGTDSAFDCLFLGSGTVEQQFRHQVALSVTREYVDEQGAGFEEKSFNDKLSLVNRLTSDRQEFERFRAVVADFRYLDG